MNNKMNKVRWGVISTANIGVEKVIPALQKSKYCDLAALASRNIEKAEKVAGQLSMPNHLHVHWSIKALKAGKHVLCEKPIGLTAAEVQELLDETQKHPQLKIMEAFMYRHHPQWLQVQQLIKEGKIGNLKTIQSFFTYYNVDSENIRNKTDMGGGALMDIGCYCISLSRFIFGIEPQQVFGIVEYDPKFRTDRLTSGILNFGKGTSTFTCATQLVPYQGVTILGTEGLIDIEIPFTPPDKPCRIWHQYENKTEKILIDACNQYTIQGDLFSQAVLNNTEVPTPLEDAMANMKVIEAVTRSAETGNWI
jgi:predicted dehydrogenase